jgi:hypothetical protein
VSETSKAPKAPRLTHFVPHDAPGRRIRQALCGLYVRQYEHDDTPTCEDCRLELARREESLGP